MADPFLLARATLDTPQASTSHSLHDGDNALERLLLAEYGQEPDGPATTAPALLPPEDLATAALRRARRSGTVLPIAALLAHGRSGPHATVAATEMWPETVRWHGAAHAEESLRSALRHTTSPKDTTFLIDLAIAADLRPLTTDATAQLLETADRDLRHTLWRYLHQTNGPDAPLPAITAAADPYERLLLRPPRLSLPRRPEASGLCVVQSMLLGGIETPGEGASGGLSVLLGGLGDQLVRSPGIGCVITLVAAGHQDFVHDPRLSYERSAGHHIVRVPVDAPTVPAQGDMHRHHAALAWWVVHLLRQLPPVDVFHLRYADDGSLALADAAERLGSDMVFTVTPDPHRHLSRRHADTRVSDPRRMAELRFDLHKVFAADRLVARATRVVSIPGRSGSQELMRYFPQIVGANAGAGPTAAPEGITPFRASPHREVNGAAPLRTLYADSRRGDALGPEDQHLPLWLCVGRLHPMKQQDHLVRAWLATEMWRVSTLVLIGGARIGATEVEKHMRSEIDRLLEGNLTARRRLALLPARENQWIRSLERVLADPARGVPAWYVCPSAKEEFGIAVLEAMEAGLPVAGPHSGGVPHYLQDGVNGILWDTNRPAGLEEGMRRLARLPKGKRLDLAKAGQETVRQQFSVERMARVLAAEYRSARKAVRPGQDRA
ncbi:glycosyltransferase family 4 protein [Streptomyces sp. cg35]|uniref:glycosyltransferase family 4 protein n=1 Tax=Streptomyces sp. cg35 TaxID=3421650 RepID=UPI003D164D8F